MRGFDNVIALEQELFDQGYSAPEILDSSRRVLRVYGVGGEVFLARVVDCARQNRRVLSQRIAVLKPGRGEILGFEPYTDLIFSESDQAAIIRRMVGDTVRPGKFEERRRVAVSLSFGMWQLHRRGVAHGDVRVENIRWRQADMCLVDPAVWHPSPKDPVAGQGNARTLVAADMKGFGTACRRLFCYNVRGPVMLRSDVQWKLGVAGSNLLIDLIIATTCGDPDIGLSSDDILKLVGEIFDAEPSARSGRIDSLEIENGGVLMAPIEIAQTAAHSGGGLSVALATGLTELIRRSESNCLHLRSGRLQTWLVELSKACYSEFMEGHEVRPPEGSVFERVIRMVISEEDRDRIIAKGIDEPWREELLEHNQEAAQVARDILAEGVPAAAYELELWEVARRMFPDGVTDLRVRALVDEDASRAEELRGQLFHEGVVRAADVQSELGVQESALREMTATGCIVSFVDHSEEYCPVFQFAGGPSGLERVFLISALAELRYPSVGNASQWFDPLRHFDGLSLAEVVVKWTTDELMMVLDRIRADAVASDW